MHSMCSRHKPRVIRPLLLFHWGISPIKFEALCYAFSLWWLNQNAICNITEDMYHRLFHTSNTQTLVVGASSKTKISKQHVFTLSIIFWNNLPSYLFFSFIYNTYRTYKQETLHFQKTQSVTYSGQTSHLINIYDAARRLTDAQHTFISCGLIHSKHIFHLFLF